MGSKIFIPKIGANIESVEIGKIFVKKGDVVKKGDNLFEMTTEKATFDVEAEISGKILSLNCKENDELNVLDEIGFIGDEREKIPELKISTKQETFDRIKATPAAKKLIKEHGLDLKIISSKISGIIKEKDVLEFVQNQRKDIKIEKIDFRKKAEIKNLLKTQEYIYSSVTISISAKKIKQKVKDYSDKYKIRLTILEYISYAIACSLKKFTKLNAYYTSNGICTYNNINLGIAVDINENLIVPVIKDANKLNLLKFSSRFNELVMDIIKGQIEVEDLRDGTFTITDLSSYGALHFNPVINANQSAILGVGAEYDSCFFKDNKLIYDPKINLILAFDHRVIDGKYALRFLREFKEDLEK